MEGLKGKSKRLNIDDEEGCLVDQSLFTTFAFTKNFEVKIHANANDVDICFIPWIKKVCWLV